MGSVYNPDFSATPPEDDEPDEMDIDAQLSAMPGIGGMYQSILAGRQKRQQQTAADTAQMWQNYRDQMTQERVGPSKLERIASALTAFGAAPTRNGNFFQALNAANKNMLETGAEAAAADRARKKALSELSFKQAQALAAQKETGATSNEAFQIAALKAAASASKTGLPKQQQGVDAYGNSYTQSLFSDGSNFTERADGKIDITGGPTGMASAFLASRGGGAAAPATVGAAPAPAAAGRPAGVPPTWTLMTDKDGNQAYVSPDGKKFKEVS